MATHQLTANNHGKLLKSHANISRILVIGLKKIVSDLKRSKGELKATQRTELLISKEKVSDT